MGESSVAVRVVRQTFVSMFVAGALAGFSASLYRVSVPGAIAGALLALGYAAFIGVQCYRVCASPLEDGRTRPTSVRVARIGLSFGLVVLILGLVAGLSRALWSQTPAASGGLMMIALLGAVMVARVFRRAYSQIDSV